MRSQDNNETLFFKTLYGNRESGSEFIKMIRM